LSTLAPELSGKNLELLKEIVPRATRFAILWNTAYPGPAPREIQEAARALGVQLQLLGVGAPAEFERAFEAMTRASAEALMVLQSPMFLTHQRRIADLAEKHRLPAMYQRRDYVEAGGLIAYGSSRRELFRRAAAYVDKILKGAKPADLPVEQPMKFELVINLKTAMVLGLTIPPALLFQADEVIK
jgi:putative ABC transport system substrate-binding protein